jgi:hypothetical protein
VEKKEFLEVIESLYEEASENGISAEHLYRHFVGSLHLPTEEGWAALEELLATYNLIVGQKTPQCNGYEMVAEDSAGIRLHICLREGNLPKATVIMFNKQGIPTGYDEQYFRNPKLVGKWLHKTIKYFLEQKKI